MSAAPALFYTGTPAAKPDRHFVRSIGEHFAEPPTDETVILFGDQIMSLHGRSSSPTKDGAGVMQTSPRVITGELPKRSSGLNADRSLSEEVKDALLADHGHLRARKKHIARLAGGISPRTVEGWEQGKSVPHLEHFLELGKHSPALRAIALRLWGMEADADPAFQRELIQFLQSRVRR